MEARQLVMYGLDLALFVRQQGGKPGGRCPSGWPDGVLTRLSRLVERCIELKPKQRCAIVDILPELDSLMASTLATPVQRTK
jgi:hypothetical protein